MKKSLEALMSSKLKNWRTPRPLFNWLHAQFRFWADSMADSKNALLRRHFTKETDGLRQDYTGRCAFKNPEFGRGLIDPAVRHSRHWALHHGACFVNLLPSRVGTGWWKDLVMQRDSRAGALLRSSYDAQAQIDWYVWQALTVGVHHIDGRLVFDHPDGKEADAAPFDAAIVIHASPGWRPPVYSAQSLRRSGWSAPALTDSWPR